MRVSKVKYLNEFEKCGEIMVAVKDNKFAMVCSFCLDTFAQLQSFMRHLQMQHNDKLRFPRELDIYAVEELLSQTANSSAIEFVEENNTNPIKCFEVTEVRTDEKENNLGNLSILKALEDCDVSVNLLENMDITISDAGNGEDSNLLSNTLLKEIEADWKESLTNKIDINGTSDVLDEPVNTANNNNKISSPKDLKNLLVALDGLEDVDTLLESLEDGVLNLSKKPRDSKKTHKDFKVNGKQEFLKCLKQLEIDLDMDINSVNEKHDSLTNLPPHKLGADKDTIEKNTSIKDQNVPVKRTLNNLPTTKSNQTFEYKIEDLMAMIDEDTTKKEKDFSLTQAKENSFYDVERVSSHDLSKDLNFIRNCSEDSVSSVINQSSLSVALNEDLNKALTDALGDEDENLIDPQHDETLNQELLNLLHQELNEEENQCASNPLNEAAKTTDNKNVSLKAEEICSENTFQKQGPSEVSGGISQNQPCVKFKSEPCFKTKYQKTNLKANKILNFKVNVIAKPKDQQVLRANKQSLKNETVAKIIKGNHEVFREQKLYPSITNRPQTPQNIQNYNGEGKTPVKINKENKAPLLNASNTKGDNFMPNTDFINTRRGERTPLKTEEMFSKQSPKTQEKQESFQLKSASKTKILEMLKNLNELETDGTLSKLHPLTNKKDLNIQEATIIPTNVQKMLQTSKTLVYKCSPKTQQSQDLNPQTNSNQQEKKKPKIVKQNTPQSREVLKKSPQLLDKEMYIINEQNISHKKPIITPSSQISKSRENIKLNSPIETSPKTPFFNNNKNLEVKIIRKPIPIDNKIQSNNTSPVTPTKETSILVNNSLKPSLTTPQTLKKLSIKLPKFTPDKLMQRGQIKSSKVKSPETNLNKILGEFKFPDGLTLTKIARKSENATQSQANEIVETPVKIGYCKQNFSETSLATKTNDLFGKLTTKTKSIGSKIRERKPSIDILPSTTEPIKTPHHSNLNSKSYAVNRTARKKEVLQRMRYIKKQIFKSIGNGDNCSVTKVIKTKSPPIKQNQRNKPQIENVEVLPPIDTLKLTTLIDSSNNLNSTTSTSPKNLNDDQKQAKKSLENSKPLSPINDDEKLLKKSLKRTASSPLLPEPNPAKQPYSVANKKRKVIDHSPSTPNELPKKSSPKTNSKSPPKQSNDTETKTNNLDATQLDLSESMVNFLQVNSSFVNFKY